MGIINVRLIFKAMIINEIIRELKLNVDGEEKDLSIEPYKAST